MNSTPETLFVGQNIISKDVVDSTNNLAIQLLAKLNLPEGSVIMAQEQQAGRGQQGTTWESEHGKNLLTSFIFYPTFLHSKNIFLLNMTFSLALYDFACRLLKKNVSVKWPNDLYHKNKKLAGLLIENSIRNSEFNYSIVGIGINVNQTKFNSNSVNPTSLKSELKEELAIPKTFNLLCECIEARYLKLKSANANTMKNEYLKVLYQFDVPANYHVGEKIVSGKIVDVMDDGKLVIENEGGKRDSYDFKEISIII